MSDYEDSTVTYTVMSSLFRGLPDIGSPGVDGPPVIPEDPYAYVDPEDDLEEDPVDYPADGGDEDDDEDESSDDEDDDIDIEGDEEEDEYLAHADSTTVTLPAVDHAPSTKETEPFETDESAATSYIPCYC
uniref:Uncharacterized protein n=1 Tax=Tanacetum cinerariifolium TaxID=118510 RepID=A0A699IP60_TANCI|nr:hypothetical protein [Tanacetum cinerariifolium]